MKGRKKREGRGVVGGGGGGGKWIHSGGALTIEQRTTLRQIRDDGVAARRVW